MVSVFEILAIIIAAFLVGAGFSEKLHGFPTTKDEEKEETCKRCPKTIEGGLDLIRKRFHKECEKARDEMVDALKEGRTEITVHFNIPRLMSIDVRHLHDVMDAHPDLRELGVRVVAGKDVDRDWFHPMLALRITQYTYGLSDRGESEAKDCVHQKGLTAGEPQHLTQRENVWVSTEYSDAVVEKEKAKKWFQFIY